MSRARSAGMRRIALLGVILGLGSGCTHYHYYGQASPMQVAPQYAVEGGQVYAAAPQEEVVVSTAPVTSPEPVLVKTTPVVSGAICEVPQSGVVIGNGVVKSPTVVKAPGQQYVVQQPPAPRSRFSWRRPDPESVAATRIDGSVSNSAVR